MRTKKQKKLTEMNKEISEKVSLKEPKIRKKLSNKSEKETFGYQNFLLQQKKKQELNNYLKLNILVE